MSCLHGHQLLQLILLESKMVQHLLAQQLKWIKIIIYKSNELIELNEY